MRDDDQARARRAERRRLARALHPDHGGDADAFAAAMAADHGPTTRCRLRCPRPGGRHTSPGRGGAPAAHCRYGPGAPRHPHRAGATAPRLARQ